MSMPQTATRFSSTDLDQLPPSRRTKIVALQRGLIENVEALLTTIEPKLKADPAKRLPAAMLFFRHDQLDAHLVRCEGDRSALTPSPTWSLPPSSAGSRRQSEALVLAGLRCLALGVRVGRRGSMRRITLHSVAVRRSARASRERAERRVSRFSGPQLPPNRRPLGTARLLRRCHRRRGAGNARANATEFTGVATGSSSTSAAGRRCGCTGATRGEFLTAGSEEGRVPLFLERRRQQQEDLRHRERRHVAQLARDQDQIRRDLQQTDSKDFARLPEAGQTLTVGEAIAGKYVCQFGSEPFFYCKNP